MLFLCIMERFEKCRDYELCKEIKKIDIILEFNYYEIFLFMQK